MTGRMKKLNQLIVFQTELDMQQYFRPAGKQSVFEIRQEKRRRERGKDNGQQNNGSSNNNEKFSASPMSVTGIP